MLRFSVLAFVVLSCGCAANVVDDPEPSDPSDDGGEDVTIVLPPDGGEDDAAPDAAPPDVCDDHDPCTIDAHPPGHCTHLHILGCGK